MARHAILHLGSRAIRERRAAAVPLVSLEAHGEEGQKGTRARVIVSEIAVARCIRVRCFRPRADPALRVTDERRRVASRQEEEERLTS